MFKAEILILSILIIESFQPLLGQLRAGSSLEYVYFIFLKYIFNIMSQYSLPSIKWKNNLNLQRKAKTNTYKNVNQHIIKEHLKVNDLIWKKKKNPNVFSLHLLPASQKLGPFPLMVSLCLSQLSVLVNTRRDV